MGSAQMHHAKQETVLAAARCIVGSEDLLPEAAVIVTCRAQTLFARSASLSTQQQEVEAARRRNILLAQYASWRARPTPTTFITVPEDPGNALVMLRRITTAVHFFTDRYIDDAARDKQQQQQQQQAHGMNEQAEEEEIRRALFRIQVYNELFRIPPGSSSCGGEEEEMFFLKLFSTAEVEIMGCVCEFLFRYFSPVFNEIATSNDHWALQGVIPSDIWPGPIWENPWLREIVANGLTVLHIVLQAHSPECRAAILTSRLGIRGSYLLDRIIGALPYLLVSCGEEEEEDEGEVWNRFQRGWATVLRRKDEVLSQRQRQMVAALEKDDGDDDGKRVEKVEVFTVMPMFKCKASVVSV